MANVKKINGYDLIDSKSDYSTSEIDTGKKWIDGKTIYRKVIDTGAIVADENTGVKDTAHGITNLGEIIDFKCYGLNSTTGAYYTLPFASFSGGHFVSVNLSINSTVIRMIFRDDTGGHVSGLYCDDSYTILEYTKSV